MNIKGLVRKFINGTDDDYIESEEQEYEDDFDFAPDQSPLPEPQIHPVHSGNVVNINSSKNASGQVKPHVVFQKIDRFEEVAEVADILNEKRIVILNLETCPNDASQRIIDFLYGVAYANHGVFKKVAGRAYIITPYSVPVTGELLDEISGGSSNE